ncbi:MAG: DUF3084 domain-containing protein [Prochlorotrichaceae cyanobacterium]
MAGYLLIISVLLLGGVIATVGDRLGYKVGKARLSWFNLRPRDTAVLITILTGGCISATTLGILFAASDSLRTGVFELEKIQNRLTDARTDLEAAQAEKERIEEERDQARRDRVAAQNRLNEINQFLKEAQAEQQATAEVLDDVVGKADRLRSEVERLEGDRRELVQQRDQVRQQIQERDRELQQQETVIAEGTVRLQDLEAQQRFLDEAIVDLEQDLLLLRERRVVLARGEVLAAQLLQVNTRSEAEERVDLLLRQANQVAQRKTLPGTGAENDVVIQIPQAEVDRLIETLSDGQPYVVRVLSAGNYITGESSVLVFTDVSLNRVIFPAGQVIASTAIDPTSINTSELRDRINLLLSAAQYRSRQAGIVNDNIEIPIESLVGFLTQVSLYDRPLVIQAIASEPAYTVGPLRLAFLALENDQIIFRSNPAPPPRL